MDQLLLRCPVMRELKRILVLMHLESSGWCPKLYEECFDIGTEDLFLLEIG